MTKPPGVAVWLLRRRLHPRWRDFVLGDLQEEFDALARSGPAAARRWYWRQALHCLVRPPRVPRAERRLDTTLSGDPMVRTITADVRYAVRVLRHSPSFSLAVVAVLALGIGATAAIFTLVNAVLLRPLPFEESDRLVRLFHRPPQTAFPGLERFSVSAANFYDWQRQADAFEGMALYRFRSFTLTGGSEPEPVTAGALGAGFFEVIRVRPLLGRTFLPEEDRPGRSHVAVLSERFWRTHFGGDPGAIGRAVALDGEPYTIVGVMPARFSVEAWSATARDFWVPIGYTDEERAVRDNHNDAVVARLRPGVDLARAQAEMDLISTRLEREYPQENSGWGAVVVPLRDVLVGDVRLPLVMLLSAVGLVLLIACANVGNLMFTRALSRRKELAIRAALGAGRARVFRQLLAEALVLALAGGAAGLLLARLALTAGAALLASQIPRADELSIDLRVVLFVVAVSAASALLAGILPAIRAGRTDLTDALKEGGRHEGVVGMRTRRLLIVGEVALSLVLLMGAGVMFRTLVALRHVEPGFDPAGVLTLRVSLPDTRYDTPEKVRLFVRQLLDRVRALPGVESAGAIDDLPSQGGSVQPIVLEGRPELPPRDQVTVAVRKVTPGYLATMRIGLIRGRDVSEDDGEAMIVSRGAARLLWGDEDPIGRRVTLPLESRSSVKQVVGVVEDVRQGDLAAAPDPAVYEYSRQHVSSSMALVLRTSLPPASLAPAARDAVRALDPSQPVEDVQTMEQVLEATLTSQRFSVSLLGVFALLALVLASVGIYSVLSYIVRGRSREIAIRAALGARTTDVVGLVVREGMRPAVLGIVIGGIAAVASARLLDSMVFGVSATDPLTFGLVAAALALVALLASLVPAYRATRLDPLRLMRPN